MGACMTVDGNRTKRGGWVWLMPAGPAAICGIYPCRYLLQSYVRVLTPLAGVGTSLGFAEFVFGATRASRTLQLQPQLLAEPGVFECDFVMCLFLHCDLSQPMPAVVLHVHPCAPMPAPLML